MSAGDEKNRAYIELAREVLQQYTQGLLRENEKLRAINAALESESRLMELEIGEARAVLSQRDSLRKVAEELETDRNQLLAVIGEVRQERDAVMTELHRLRSRFLEVEEENVRFADQYHAIEAQSSNLSNLYVASYQLHSSVEREVVLNTILEIVINLIGSEEVAIYQRTAAGGFEIAASFGIVDRVAEALQRDGIFARRVENGQVWLNDGSDRCEYPLTASIPLKIGDDIIGAIFIFRLLDHKTQLQPVDHELFELLAVHAGTALHCATVHGQIFGAAVAS